MSEKQPQYIDDSEVWIQDHCFHRLDGPAVVDADGSVEWWVEGRLVSRDWRPLGPLSLIERKLVLGLWQPGDDLDLLIVALHS